MTWLFLLCCPCQESVDELLKRLTDERIETRDAAQSDLLALLRKDPAIRKRLSDEAEAAKDSEARERLRAVVTRFLGSAPLSLDQERSVERILLTTPILWRKMAEWRDLDRALGEAPKSVLRLLGDSLMDGTAVQGLGYESQIYTVSGNALTLLEEITDRSFDDDFDIHDHRGWKPDKTVRQKWISWLEDIRERPGEEIFEGLSYQEKERVRAILRTGPRLWSEEAGRETPERKEREVLARTKGKIVPYLILMLRDTRYALYSKTEQIRYCDAANRLLRLWTGESFGEIAPRRWEAPSSEVRKSVERAYSQWTEWWNENRGRGEWK